MADMSIFTAIQMGAQGMSAERTRLNIASMNLANAQVTRTVDGGPYVPRSVVFEAVPYNPEESGVNTGMSPLVPVKSFDNALQKASARLETVRVKEVVEDKFPFKEVYDPSHPDADENGIVRLPNVNVMEQMVDVMNASRAYEANVTAINTAKSMAMKAMELGK